MTEDDLYLASRMSLLAQAQQTYHNFILPSFVIRRLLASLSLPDYRIFRLMKNYRLRSLLKSSVLTIYLYTLNGYVISTLFQLARPPFDEGWNLGYHFLTLWFER